MMRENGRPINLGVCMEPGRERRIRPEAGLHGGPAAL